MARMQNRGKTPSDDTSVATKAYLETLLAQYLTQSQINSLISAGYASYATKSYVDTQDGLNATQAYIDAGDAARLLLSQRNANNGVAGLDATGKIDVSRVSFASTQRWPKPYYTPSAYNAGSVNAAETEVAVYTHTIASPGFTYKLLVGGQVDVRTTVDEKYPIVRVRVGSTTGEEVASGRGTGEYYQWGLDEFDRTGTTLGGGWDETWTGPGTGHVETNGSEEFYVKNGTSQNRAGVFRKVNDFATSSDDYQEVEMVCNAGAEIESSVGVNPYTRIFGRLRGDNSSYVNFLLGSFHDLKAYLQYRPHGGSLTTVTSASLSGHAVFGGTTWTAKFGTISDLNKRRFQLIRKEGASTTTIIDWTDTTAATTMGSSNRNWGFGVQAGMNELFLVPISQAAPPEWGSVNLYDPALANYPDQGNYSTVAIVPGHLGDQTARTGSITLYVTLRSSGSSGGAVSATNVRPRLFVVPVPV